MKHIIIVAVAVCYCVFMTGCASKSSTAQHVHSENCSHNHSHTEGEGHTHSEDEHSGGHAADEIIFPQSQAARVDFEVSEAEPSVFSSVIRCSGEVVSAQDDSFVLTAPVSGVVRFAVPSFADGSRVGGGSPVLYIDTKTVEGGDVAVKAEAAYRAAEARLNRARALLADKIISQREFEDIQQEYAVAESEWKALGAVSGKGVAVKAPYSGYAAGISVREGDFVNTGDPLFSIVANCRFRLVASVPQRYYPALKDIASANFVGADGRLVELSAIGGRRVASSMAADASSPLITVTFEFPAAGDILPGSLVEVYLLGRQREGVIALPLGAVTESQGHYFVFVQLDDEGYQRREVKIGDSDGSRVEILSGLQEGERVVMRGAVHVKMAAMSSIPHSHSH